MVATRSCLMALGAVVLAGCSADVIDTDISQSQDAIVRPTATGGRDQVVMLYMQTVKNGQLGARTCTGTYFAPRVVLTAAHCMANIWGNQVFAYYGNSYADDVAQLQKLGDTLSVPAPGQPSNWAQADSYETHPNWDPNLVAPDIAVVYLDRKLPFAPLPLARFRLENGWLNAPATITGWGANLALSADISQVSGSTVQRVGNTRILGSPTQSDYHADDPNPGMLVPAIRQSTIKTDGRAPYSNTCAGDSGSPLLVTKCGQTYIAGVSSWTGLWCEDYSLFARIDPVLPFLDKAAQRGGQLKVTPHLECVAPNSDGTLTAYFGYTNNNGVAVTMPYGSRNALNLDLAGNRPVKFAPGKHSWVFGIDFAPNDRLTYRIAPENAPPSEIHVTPNAPRCGSDTTLQVSCGGYCRATLASGCQGPLPSFEQCMSDCISTADLIPECADTFAAANDCYARTPTGQSNWACTDDGFLPTAPNCTAEIDSFFACWFGG